MVHFPGHYNREMNRLVDKFSENITTKGTRNKNQIEKSRELLGKINKLLDERVNKLNPNDRKSNAEKLNDLLFINKRSREVRILTPSEEVLLERAVSILEGAPKDNIKPKPSPDLDMEDLSVVKEKNLSEVKSFVDEEDIPAIEEFPAEINPFPNLEEAQSAEEQPQIEEVKEEEPQPQQPKTPLRAEEKQETPIRDEEPTQVPLGGPPPPPPPGGIPPPPPPLGQKFVVVQKLFPGEPAALPDNWKQKIKDKENPSEAAEMQKTVRDYATALEKTINPIKDLIEKHTALTEEKTNLTANINADVAELKTIEETLEKVNQALNSGDNKAIVRLPIKTQKGMQHVNLISDEEFNRLNTIQKQNRKNLLPEGWKLSRYEATINPRRTLLQESLKKETEELENIKKQINGLEEIKNDLSFKEFKEVIDLYENKKRLVSDCNYQLKQLDRAPKPKSLKVKKEEVVESQPDLQESILKEFNDLDAQTLLMLKTTEEWMKRLK